MKDKHYVIQAAALPLAMMFVALLAASPSFAQDVTHPPIRATVPYPFVVGTKTLPAGAYEFIVDASDTTVSIHGPKGADAEALVVTTLAPAPHPTAADHTHLVFDKVGEVRTLAEIWEPGQDGLLMHVTKGKHGHDSVHVDKGQKK